MIYEQSTDTFWTHDFFLDLRDRDIVPTESSEAESEIVMKRYPNVWRDWIFDTPERLETMYDKDIKREVKMQRSKNNGQLYFQPYRILKDEEDLD